MSGPPKDPADLLSKRGIGDLHALMAAAKTGEEYFAEQLLAPFATSTSISPGEAEQIVTDACAAAFDHGRAEAHLWPLIETRLSALSVRTAELARLREKHDQGFATRNATMLIEAFAAKLESMQTDDCKAELLAAAVDPTLLAAVGSMEISSSGSAVIALGLVRGRRGCAQLVTTFVNAGRQHARRVQKQRLAQSGKLLARDSHVYLASQAGRVLSYDHSAELRFDEGRLYRYEAAVGIFEEVPSHEVAQCVHSFDGALYERQTAKGSYPAPLSINASTVNGVKEVLSEAEGVAAPNFFADGKPGVVVANGVLVVDDEDVVVLRPHAPDYRLRHRLDVNYDPDATAPRWSKALEQWFANTPDAKARERILAQFTLVALFGAATLFQKALFLLGDSGTGKSTFLKVLKALFPRAAVSSIDPQELGHEYAAAELAGKLLNVGFDMSALRVVESAGFKKAVTGDMMTGRFPFEPMFTYEPMAAHIYALNTLPQVKERTDAVWDRVAIVGFPNDFRNSPEDREMGLERYIIENELAGVLSWAVREGGGVFRDKALSIPVSSNDAVDAWAVASDAVATWFTKTQPKIQFHGHQIANIERHYNDYKFWSADFGFYVVNLNTFRDRLERVATPAVVWAMANYESLRVPAGSDPKAYARKHGVPASSVHRKYKAHARAQGLPELSTTALGRELRPHFDKVKSGKVYYLAQAEVKPVTPEDAPPAIVAIDTETTLITADCPTPDLVCLSYRDCDGEEGVLAPADAVAFVAHLLRSGETVLVLHNTAFDFSVLVRAANSLEFTQLVYDAYEGGRISDTAIREALLLNAEGRLKTSRIGLSKLVEKYLGIDISHSKKEGTQRTSYGNLRGIHVDDWPEAALSYALDDARFTLDVWRKQGDVMDPIPNEVEQVAAAWALRQLHVAGVAVDHAWAGALEEALTAGMAELKEVLPFFENGKRKMNLVRQSVEAAYKSRPLPRTKTGEVATGADVLRASGDPDLEKLAEYEKLRKLKSTFVDTLLTAEVHHAEYDVLKKTGRTSCRNPNFQQLPKKGQIRECVVPRPGFALIAADYGTLELRTHAQVLLDWFGESELAERLRGEVDLHLDLAAAVLGLSYEEAKKRRQHDPEIEDARSMAKAANFGFPGGMAPGTFVAHARDSYGIDISDETAGKLKSAWLSRYPEMRRYFGRIEAVLKGGRGRVVQKRSGRIQGGATFTEAANSFFQGLAADGAKRALFLVVRECFTDPTSPLWGCNVVLFVHDEIVIEAPLDRVHEAAQRLEELMIEGMSHFVPDIPIVVEALAMDRWSKSAKRVVLDERLHVWSSGQSLPKSPITKDEES